VMHLVPAVAVVGSAEESDVPIEARVTARVGVAHKVPVRPVREVEAAGRIEALDRGVRVHVQTADERSAVYDQVEVTHLRGTVQHCLKSGGVICAATSPYVAVEPSAAAAGIDDSLADALPSS